jgi:aquaporin Z
MNRYATELIGTFFLVLTVALTVIGGTPLAPLAIGSALMVMVYMGGHVSGGHYNPAVTVAVRLRGAMEPSDFLPYILAQCLGAILAGFAAAHIMGDTLTVAPAADAGMVAVLLSEFLFTFALCLVVLNTATADETSGNSYFGLAIGFTVMIGAFSVGGVSGGAFNPAVGTGPILVDALIGGGGFGSLWIYWVAPVLGGVAAASVFSFQHPAAADA